jgi:hypothetical protein
MVEFVGAHEMANRSQAVHVVAQIRRQPNRGPDPQIAVSQPGDDGACRVGRAVEADILAFGDPQRVMHLLKHSGDPICGELPPGTDF